VASYSIKRAVRFKGARLIYASPFGDSLSHIAAPWLTIKPGSELPLIIGLIQTLIDEGMWRKDFLGEKPDGFASLREAVGRLDPASLKTLTGIDIETIKDVARIVSSTRRCASSFSDAWALVVGGSMLWIGRPIHRAHVTWALYPSGCQDIDR
jgi:predicted molibdopterin-dependent oxidoreductase YjgC